MVTMKCGRRNAECGVPWWFTALWLILLGLALSFWVSGCATSNPSSVAGNPPEGSPAPLYVTNRAPAPLPAGLPVQMLTVIHPAVQTSGGTAQGVKPAPAVFALAADFAPTPLTNLTAFIDAKTNLAGTNWTRQSAPYPTNGGTLLVPWSNRPVFFRAGYIP